MAFSEGIRVKKGLDGQDVLAHKEGTLRIYSIENEKVVLPSLVNEVFIKEKTG